MKAPSNHEWLINKFVFYLTPAGISNIYYYF